MRNYEKHIRLMDVDGSGVKREVAIIKEFSDGTISYIQLDLLDRYDLGRMRSAVESQIAAQYDLYEVLSMITLNNGVNALDYFHQLAKLKVPEGGRIPQTQPRRSVRSARTSDGRGKVIGSEFSDPNSSVVADRAVE